MKADAASGARSHGTGEVGPDAYGKWRMSTLGAITESLQYEIISDLTGPLTDKKILDVGCGDGTLASRFRHMGASLVIGCDPDSRMIVKATRAAPERDAIRYLLGRAENLPLRDQSFDVVTAITVLCFVEQRSRAVREMARVLNVGGRLVIGELGRWSTWAASRRVRAWMGDELWREARFTTAHELRALATEAGLRVDRMYGAIYYPRITLAARVMKPIDPMLGRITTVGAAFIAVSATRIG